MLLGTFRPFREGVCADCFPTLAAGSSSEGRTEMHPVLRFFVVSAGALTLSVLAVPAASPLPGGPAGLPPGCASDRTAVAYKSDGTIVHGGNFPVPCAN